MTMQIVYQNHATGHLPHALQDAHALVIRQMVKEERCHDDVEGLFAKRHR